MGYALAVEEIVRDCPSVAWIVHASGSAGTQGGLLAGLLALRHPAHVIGVDVDAQAVRVAHDVRYVGRKASAILGVEDSWTDNRVEVAGVWSGPKYGESDSTTEQAIGLAARMEGLALDPVYSGKGMAGLIGLARQGRFQGRGPVVWIHTGGATAMFAYPTTMARSCMPWGSRVDIPHQRRHFCVSAG
jgi:L-cysteate sulfo-lyase